ncbi:MAG: FtsX-like permease family protein, partial [Anaerolineales bacterium]|nr:FtsX-like permease family protein [Anaerolineales bacterium]
KLAEEVGVGVGDWVTIRYTENKERNLQVVGTIFDPIFTNSAHMQRDVMLRDVGSVGRAGTVWIKATSENPEEHSSLANRLREFYNSKNMKVNPLRGIFGMGDTTYETGTKFINQFNFLVVLLSIMAVVIGGVGSIALSGALSLSVLERRREIGVMRAIGASSGNITRLFVGEGLILGWLSWVICLPLSIPAGKLMVKALGAAFQLDIVYLYTPMGAILWLFIITILSILASWAPARGASRISVRESLAYQ